MTNFIYVFIVCIVLIAVIMALVVFITGAHKDDDSPFRDENGNHTYYERSIIEKDEFHRNNPEIPYSDIRSLRRLFRLKNRK